MVKLLQIRCKNIIFLLSIILMVGSCKKDSNQLNSIQNNRLTEAKAFVESNVAITSKASFLSSVGPNWNKVIQTNEGGKIIYEVECENPNHLINAPKNSYKSKDEFEIKSAIKLIVIEEDGQSFSAYFMFISGENAGSSTNHYKSLPNFTGTVMFYGLEGTVSNGYEYKNGMINKVINVAPKFTENEVLLNGGSATSNNKSKTMLYNGGAMDCVISTWDVYQQSCITAGPVSNLQNAKGKVLSSSGGTTCTWVWIGSFDTVNCIYIGANENGGSSGGNDGGATGGNSGSGGNTVNTQNAFNPSEFEFISDPNISLKDMLDCFGTISDNAATYSISLSADIPVNSDPSKLVNYNSVPPEVGHAFITLTKTSGNTSINKSFGFYPDPQILSITAAGVGSKINDNGGHTYDAKITTALTSGEFGLAMAAAVSLRNNSYDINDYNCTDYALAVYNSYRDSTNNLSIPNWIGSWGFNYGRTPNALYQTLMQKKSYGDNSVSYGGTAPSKTSPCPN